LIRENKEKSKTSQSTQNKQPVRKKIECENDSDAEGVKKRKLGNGKSIVIGLAEK
jgi:hypothetical protein